MVFSSTRTQDHSRVVGAKRWVHGTFTNTLTSTGGNIDTGLIECEFIKLTTSGGSVSGNNPTVDETLPVAGSAVTIKTSAGEDGFWMAYGR